MLALLNIVAYTSVLLGMLFCFFRAAFQKSFKKALFIFLVPFYVFGHIFKMPETQTKKLLGIMVMGGFVVYVFTQLFLILLTPNF